MGDIARITTFLCDQHKNTVITQTNLDNFVVVVAGGIGSCAVTDLQPPRV